MSPVIGGKKIRPQVLNYLHPGCGFGGSCFPKDVRALAAFAKKKKHSPLMLASVLDINKKQPLRLVELTREKLGSLKDKKIAVLGLAFKPETDDIRESPAIAIIKELISKKAKVFAYDPIVTSQNVQPLLKNLKFTFSKSLQEAIKGKDACLLVTNWKEFKSITPEFLKKNMTKPILIDGRGFFNSKDFKNGEYSGIGLGK